MGFLDKLLGREPLQQQRPQQAAPPTGEPYAVPSPRGGASTEDERAIARYTVPACAPPTPRTSRRSTPRPSRSSPPSSARWCSSASRTTSRRASGRRSDQPADLARSATRAEISRPGYLQGASVAAVAEWAAWVMGMGGMIAGSMLGTIAGVVVGLGPGGHDARWLRLLARGPRGRGRQRRLHDSGDGGDGGAGDGGDGGAGHRGDGSVDAAGDTAGSDVGDVGEAPTSVAVTSAADFGGGDFGGGDFGGDFGGGDFGGF